MAELLAELHLDGPTQLGSTPNSQLPTSKLVGFALLVTLLVPAFFGCTAAEAPSTPDVATWRADKDRYMRESADSPVPEEQRATFAPLPYYAIDPGYRVPAALTMAPGEAVLELPTSTGLRRKMRKIGALQFTLKGQALSLTAFVDASTNDVSRLFVPFGDLTNGSETYPGGRYLDLDRTATGIYDLDFNRAYHPFCVFNAKYDCPYPPRENRLKLPIRAGERYAPAKTARPSPQREQNGAGGSARVVELARRGAPLDRARGALSISRRAGGPAE